MWKYIKVCTYLNCCLRKYFFFNKWINHEKFNKHQADEKLEEQKRNK